MKKLVVLTLVTVFAMSDTAMAKGNPVINFIQGIFMSAMTPVAEATAPLMQGITKGTAEFGQKIAPAIGEVVSVVPIAETAKAIGAAGEAGAGILIGAPTIIAENCSNDAEGKLSDCIRTNPNPPTTSPLGNWFRNDLLKGVTGGKATQQK